MAGGVRIAVTSLHGSPVYPLTRPLTRGVPSHTYGRPQTRDARLYIRSYYRAGAIKEGSLEISGWRTLVSIESAVRYESVAPATRTEGDGSLSLRAGERVRERNDREGERGGGERQRSS